MTAEVCFTVTVIVFKDAAYGKLFFGLSIAEGRLPVRIKNGYHKFA